MFSKIKIPLECTVWTFGIQNIYDYGWLHAKGTPQPALAREDPDHILALKISIDIQIRSGLESDILRVGITSWKDDICRLPSIPSIEYRVSIMFDI